MSAVLVCNALMPDSMLKHVHVYIGSLGLYTFCTSECSLQQMEQARVQLHPLHMEPTAHKWFQSKIFSTFAKICDCRYKSLHNAMLFSDLNPMSTANLSEGSSSTAFSDESEYCISVSVTPQKVTL